MKTSNTLIRACGARFVIVVGLVLCALGASLVLTACGGLLPAGKATLTVTAGMGTSRTVVPDFAGSITGYDITLTSQDGFPGRTASGVTASQTFTDLEAGTWDVAVTAYAGTTAVASGSVTNRVITSGSTATIPVALNPVSPTGTGNFALNLRVPWVLMVNSVHWSLEQSGTVVCDDVTTGSLNGSDFVFAVSNSTTPGPFSTHEATAGVPAGSYTLVLRFFRMNTPAGTFREAVNIWGGLTSNRWVAADGTLTTERAFAANEFFDANTGLALFNLSGSNLDEDVPSSAATTPLDLGRVRTARLNGRVQAGYQGQDLSYRWNPVDASSTWIPLATNVLTPVDLPTLALRSGSNTLELKVLAADRSTSVTYTITMTAASVVTGSSAVAMEMVQVPGGTFQRDATATNLSTVGSFLMGRYEVTREQYLAVMGADPSDTGKSPTVDCPAQNISWYNAVKFCNLLSRSEGLEPVYRLNNSTNPADWGTEGVAWNAMITDATANGYRLPTFSEWQWAAMGGMSDSIASNLDTGNNKNLGGYNKRYPGDDGRTFADTTIQTDTFNSYVVTYQSGGAKTLPVGSKLPNELGIYDLYGNVWEWTGDGDAPTSGTVNNYQSAPGFSSYYGAGHCWIHSYLPPDPANVHFLNLSVAFYGANNGQVSTLYGFRVVRSLPRKVIYKDTNASSGTAPVDSQRYLEGSPVTIKGNTDNLMRGPHIQDGITQRFQGWSTDPAATATQYSSGDIIDMVAADLVLYPVWTTVAPSAAASAMLRMVGPAGGLVFKDLGSSGAATLGEGWRYLEAAPSDQNTAAPAHLTYTGDVTMGSNPWDNTYAIISAVGNTGTYAAKICADLELGGYDDWFLPSTDNLADMYFQLKQYNLGNFGNDYWSSTWINSSTNCTYYWMYSQGGATPADRTTEYRVRAARYFAGADTTYTIRYHSTSISGSASSGTAPVMQANCLPGRKVTIAANALNTMRGPTIQDGITQRLVKWNTSTAGTGTDYALGASVAMPFNDLDLYPVWTTVSTSTLADAMVGMVGPAGGWVFKDLGDAGATSQGEGWRYLEASPADLAKSGVPWAATAVNLEGTTNTGSASSFRGNTQLIVDATAGQTGTNAARMCAEYEVNGYSDWYLPAPGELALMDNNLHNANPSIGHFGEDNVHHVYWSSELNTADYNPNYYHVDSGAVSNQWLQTTAAFAVRAMRAFRTTGNTYAIRYMPNGATSGTVPADWYSYYTGETVTLQNNPGNLTNPGYVLKGWNTKADGTGDLYHGAGSLYTGTSFPASEDLTFYATWTDGLYAPQTPKVLTPNPVGTYPSNMVRVGNFLYCTDRGEPNCVKKIDLSDGTVTTHAVTGVTINNPAGIDSDGTYLYVCDNVNKIVRVNLSTFDGQVVYTGSATDLVLSADKSLLYFVNYGTYNNTNGTLMSVSVTGWPNNVLQTGLSGPAGICRDSTHLYIVEQDTNQVIKVPLADTTTKTVVGTGLSQPLGITTDGLYVYVGNWQGNNVIKMRISDGTKTVLYSNNTPWAVYNDGVRLYVASQGTNDIRMLE